MKKIIAIVLLISGYNISSLKGQVVSSFNFSLTSKPVPGWINVAGDPSVAVRTATDATTHITISSVATTNWVPIGTSASNDGGGMTGGTFFPAAVMQNFWFQDNPYVSSYNAATPQLIIGGLDIHSTYTISMTSSISTSSYDANPCRYTVTGSIVFGYIDLNANSNTTNGAVFHNIIPDANGQVKVYVNPTLDAQGALISGIQITQGSTSSLVPTVTITRPSNNDIIPEDGNVIISATASETGGTIAKVEFYADTTKLGEALTPPYNFTWVNPDEGKYTLKARAVDGLGIASVASVNVSVESLSSFWSMTGNINMKPDSNFVGNVDSVRLAFRTKNLERMSISATGNVGIGTINPAAQLHSTGTVRFQQYKNNVASDSVLTTDTSGNLKLKAVSGSSGHWSLSGTTTYDSLDNIGIGTSNTHGYKLAVNGPAIFTKVVAMASAKWPDYVFKKDYILPSLDSVARYIGVNSHLPGLPSADSVERKGIDLGSNQAVLLKKIEELTLYLIQQNKALEALKEQNNQLERQNKALQTQQARIDQLEQRIDGAKEKN